MSEGEKVTISFRQVSGDEEKFKQLLHVLLHDHSLIRKNELLVEALYQVWLMGGLWSHEALEEFVAHAVEADEGQAGREGPS